MKDDNKTPRVEALRILRDYAQALRTAPRTRPELASELAQFEADYGREIETLTKDDDG